MSNVDEKNSIQKHIAATLRDVAKQYSIQRTPPIYCVSCRLRVPETKDIEAKLRDVSEKYNSLCDFWDPEAAPEYPTLLREFCTLSLFGIDCYAKPSDSWNKSLPGQISDMFDGLVVREGEETIGQGPQEDSEEKPPIKKSAIKKNSRPTNRLPDTPEVREFLLKHPEFAPIKNEYVVGGFSNDDGNLVFDAPKSYVTPNSDYLNIPPWGSSRYAVIQLLAYLDPYSENESKKKTFQSKYDAISHKWWGEPLPSDSHLRSMETGSIDKLLFDLRKTGNEVLYLEPPPGGPCWLLNKEASQRFDRRIKKHFTCAGGKKRQREKRPIIGYLVAYKPAPHVISKLPFKEMVRMVLNGSRKGHAELYPDDPFTDNRIEKAIPLVAIRNLEKINAITNDHVRAWFLADPLSLAITPEKVATYVIEHPPEIPHDYSPDGGYARRREAFFDRYDPDEGMFWEHYWDYESDE